MNGKKFKKKVKEVIKEIEIELGGRRERKIGWWNEKCEQIKKEVKRELREWRRRGGEGLEYKEKKKDYRDMCKRKKKEDKE